MTASARFWERSSFVMTPSFFNAGPIGALSVYPLTTRWFACDGASFTASFAMTSFPASLISHFPGANSRSLLTVYLIAPCSRVTCAFFSGVLLFRWRDRLGAAPLARHWWLAPALTALALTLPVGQTLRPWFDALFVLFGAPLLVWLGVASHAPERALPCLNGLGRLSYPLYALHFPLFLAAAGLAAHFPEVRVMIAFVAMAVACAASLLIARWYDVPLRRALTARFIMSPHFGSRAPCP